MELEAMLRVVALAARCRHPGGRLVEPHLDSEANKIGVVFGAQLLFEKRRRICHGLVRDPKRVRNFHDLITAGQ